MTDLKHLICWNSGCPNNCIYLDSRIPKDCPYEEEKKKIREYFAKYLKKTRHQNMSIIMTSPLTTHVWRKNNPLRSIEEMKKRRLKT